MDGRRTLTVAELGVVDYEAGLLLQDALVAERYADRRDDTLLLLEHPHVFTLGRGGDERYLAAARGSGVPVHRVSRGGQVTYHGPGQLVGYAILKLSGRDRDVHGYLRKLEEAMIRALGAYGIEAARRDGLTGVWVGERKIASIGVGIRRWVTLHGFALNVRTELDFFERIVPCGIQGCRMTSVAELGRADVSVADFAQTMRASFAGVFGYGRIVEQGAAAIWSVVDRIAAAGEAGR
jgi:lipoate-protein ligase B